MKITIDIEAKEIAELRALLLPDERLTDSKIIDAKKQLIDEIAEEWHNGKSFTRDNREHHAIRRTARRHDRTTRRILRLRGTQHQR